KLISELDKAKLGISKPKLNGGKYRSYLCYDKKSFTSESPFLYTNFGVSIYQENPQESKQYSIHVMNRGLTVSETEVEKFLEFNEYRDKLMVDSAMKYNSITGIYKSKGKKELTED